MGVISDDERRLITSVITIRTINQAQYDTAVEIGANDGRRNQR